MTNKTLKSELQKLARDVVQRLHSGEIQWADQDWVIYPHWSASSLEQHFKSYLKDLEEDAEEYLRKQYALPRKRITSILAGKDTIPRKDLEQWAEAEQIDLTFSWMVPLKERAKIVGWAVVTEDSFEDLEYLVEEVFENKKALEAYVKKMPSS